MGFLLPFFWQEAALHPPPPPVNIRQALMTTVSSSSASAWKSGKEYLPRPLWVLEREGGKTVIELVLLNLVRTVCVGASVFVLLCLL